uniref:B30.2/SPRY domain-containing protein n=1 Tax=Latimeria chalumnae TaxID=7897 RepID=H2ZUQ5_LATCH
REGDSLFQPLEWTILHACDGGIELNLATAHPNLKVSPDKKSVWYAEKVQKFSDNRTRFDSSPFVLGSKGFKEGKHYWVVEVSEKTDWHLGIASESSQRKGPIMLSPKNGFWTIGLRQGDYWAQTTTETSLSVSKKPNKIGIFLNYSKGEISFYNAEENSLIYKFTDKFNEELFPFFGPGLKKEAGMNDKPLKIC